MPVDELIGHVLDGRYKVLEVLSEGAMGVVYRGERLKLGRPVAIKVMRDELPNELSSRKRFEVEAKAMARLEHPHCVSVLDVGLHEDKPYVVMDFISGTNLRDILDKGPLEIPRAIEMMRQILSGLGHAHELGIMHRDIKPANIMVSRKTGIGDQVKVLDFGLARLDQDSQLTGTMVLGTPAYMAPEQCTGGAIDSRTDLYACGVLLFEMLTGCKPFHSEKDDPIEVVRMHIDRPAPRLDAVRPGVDFGELETVVAHALAKTADARFQTAVEFATALDAAAAPFRVSGPHAAPSGPVPVPASGPVPKSAPVSAAKSAPVPATKAPAAQSAPVRAAQTPAAKSAPVRAAPAPTPATGRPITPRPATSPTAVATPQRPETSRTGTTQVGAAAPATAPARPQVDAKFGAQSQSPPASMRSAPGGVDAKFGAAQPAPSAKPPVDDSWALEAKEIAAAMPAKSDLSFDPSWSLPGSAKSANAAAEPDVKSEVKSEAKPAAKTQAKSDGKADAKAVAKADAKPDAPASNATPADVPSADREPATKRPPSITDPVAAFTDLPPQPEGEHLAMTPNPGPRLRQRRMILIGAGALGLIVLIAIVASRGGGSPTSAGRLDKPTAADNPPADAAHANAKPPADAAPVVVPPPPIDDGPHKAIAEANALIAEGKLDAALAKIAKARKDYFANPDLPYFAGRIQLSRQHWNDGLAAFREAIRLDESFRTNPELIQMVVDSFTTTKDRNDKIASFLHDVIGDAAVPILERATREHPDPAMRERVTKELARYKK